MSTVADFNRIEDCNKIDPLCIDSYTDFDFDPENDTGICLHTPWGGNCLDLTEIVKNAESCTTLYLSPMENPNCLVYEKEERCGDNDCIHGDDLSRIISMRFLKDVDQETPPSEGIVYMYNSQTNLFEPFDLKTTLGNIATQIQNINSAINNHENRIKNIEARLTPPVDAPSDVKVVFGNINEYSDPNVVINEENGTVTALDKAHGFYTHTLTSNAYGDEIFG